MSEWGRLNSPPKRCALCSKNDTTVGTRNGSNQILGATPKLDQKMSVWVDEILVSGTTIVTVSHREGYGSGFPVPEIPAAVGGIIPSHITNGKPLVSSTPLLFPRKTGYCTRKDISYLRPGLF